MSDVTVYDDKIARMSPRLRRGDIFCFTGIVMRYVVCSADEAEEADQGEQRQEQDAEHGDREELNEE